MHRRKQKEIIKEDTIYLNAHKATVTVTEIYRRRYNKSPWEGYGVTFTIELSEDTFKHRETIQKSELGERNIIQRFVDTLFNKTPPTSLSDFIIQTSHNAENKLNKKYTSGEIAIEQEVEAALTAIE